MVHLVWYTLLYLLSRPVFTGAWASAAADYKLLAGLAAAAVPGSALHSKEAGFLRRQAEFLLQAHELQEAESVWQVLLARTEEGSQEWVECLCHLADVQVRHGYFQTVGIVWVPCEVVIGISASVHMPTFLSRHVQKCGNSLLSETQIKLSIA